MGIRTKIANNFLTFTIVIALLVTSVYMIYKHSYVAICNREANAVASDSPRYPDTDAIDLVTLKEFKYSDCMRKKGFEA